MTGVRRVVRDAPTVTRSMAICAVDRSGPEFAAEDSPAAGRALAFVSGQSGMPRSGSLAVAIFGFRTWIGCVLIMAT